MTNGKYQISQIEYGNGDIKYVLEQFRDGEWHNCYRHKDLEEVRRAKAEREGSPSRVVSKKVVE